jgi:hypothetical protein
MADNKMLYFINIYKDPSEYFMDGDWTNWDAWWVFTYDDPWYWLHFFWTPKLWKYISFEYRKDRLTDKLFSLHYDYYDGVHLLFCFWRFRIGIW